MWDVRTFPHWVRFVISRRPVVRPVTCGLGLGGGRPRLLHTLQFSEYLHQAAVQVRLVASEDPELPRSGS